MPVIIGSVETDINVEGGTAPTTRGGDGAQTTGASLEVQVEELRAAVRALIAEEVERALRRRLPER
jgi:hypothetical protein